MPVSDGYCLKYNCHLRGIDAACQECGRAFEISNPKSFSRTPRRKLPYRLFDANILIVALYGLMWALFPTRALWPICLIFCGVAAVSFRRGFWLAVIVLLNPLPFIVLFTVSHYQAGDPYYALGSAPAAEHFRQHGRNMDPEHRIMYTGHAQGYPSDVWFTGFLHNAVLDYLLQRHGPPPNAYRGSYPAQTEAIAALQNAAPISAWKISERGSNNVELPAQTIPLYHSQGQALLYMSAFEQLDYARDEASLEVQYGPVRAVIYDADCLIVEVPGIRDTSSGRYGRGNTMIYLIDRHRGSAFAAYPTGHSQPVGHGTLRWKFTRP